MAMKLYTGKGVKLDQQKKQAFMRPVMRIKTPETLMVPLLNFGTGAMLPIPRVGETVAKNSMLARSKNSTNWVVSPVSGKLKCIERVEHPLVGSVMCATIIVRDSVPPLQTHGHDPAAMTAQGVIQAARLACILDESDGLPLYYKLQTAARKGVLMSVADGIDDMPYISSSLKTVQEYGEEANDGLGLTLKVLDGGKAALALYDSNDIDMSTIAHNFGFTDVVHMSGGYPVWPRFAEKYCGGGEYLRVGVQALCALSRAVRKGEPQTESMITVCGDCVASPANVMVTTGVTIEQILQAAGLKNDPKYVIIGDTMRGVTCDRLDVPVFPGIKGICAMSELPAPEKRTGCISCGRCVSVCPQKLFPSEAVRMYERGAKQAAAKFGCEKCEGCGACSAVCPSHIEVADIMLELSGR